MVAGTRLPSFHMGEVGGQGDARPMSSQFPREVDRREVSSRGGSRRAPPTSCTPVTARSRLSSSPVEAVRKRLARRALQAVDQLAVVPSGGVPDGLGGYEAECDPAHR